MGLVTGVPEGTFACEGFEALGVLVEVGLVLSKGSGGGGASEKVGGGGAIAPLATSLIETAVT